MRASSFVRTAFGRLLLLAALLAPIGAGAQQLGTPQPLSCSAVVNSCGSPAFTRSALGTPALLNGTGAPASTLGAMNDYYFRNDTGALEQKLAGVWTVIANFTGPTGAAGATWYTGTGAPSSGAGANGDFYFRQDTGQIYNKVTGAWAAIANLTGPGGTNGTNGTNGVNAYTATTASFTMPAATSGAWTAVASTAWMTTGQTVYVANAGYMTVSTIGSSTAVILVNAGVGGNAAAGATIASGSSISPAGPIGAGSVSTGTTGALAGYPTGGTALGPITALPPGTTAQTGAAGAGGTPVATQDYAASTLLQSARSTTTAVTSLTGTYATGSFPPTSTNGVAWPALQTIITPRSGSSTLRFTVNVVGTQGGTDEFTVAIFNGTTMVAFWGDFMSIAGLTYFSRTWQAQVASPGTTAQTYTVRVGTNSGTVFVSNQANGGATLGSTCSLTIDEIAPHP